MNIVVFDKLKNTVATWPLTGSKELTLHDEVLSKGFDPSVCLWFTVEHEPKFLKPRSLSNTPNSSQSDSLDPSIVTDFHNNLHSISTEETILIDALAKFDDLSKFIHNFYQGHGSVSVDELKFLLTNAQIAVFLLQHLFGIKHIGKDLKDIIEIYNVRAKVFSRF